MAINGDSRFFPEKFSRTPDLKLECVIGAVLEMGFCAAEQVLKAGQEPQIGVIGRAGRLHARLTERGLARRASGVVEHFHFFLIAKHGRPSRAVHVKNSGDTYLFGDR